MKSKQIRKNEFRH